MRPPLMNYNSLLPFNQIPFSQYFSSDVSHTVGHNKAVQLIEFDYHAHLDSKAGSVIGSKSPVFSWSGS